MFESLSITQKPNRVLAGSAPRAIPARVDHYRILRPLGSGGSGIVCEGEDTSLGRRVAIKLIPDEESDKTRSPGMAREARLGGAVRHEHVVSLFGAGSYVGGVYLVMEFIGARSLQSLVSNEPLPWREATAILNATCEGLIAVHKCGVVHCDIKPGNILLQTVVRSEPPDCCQWAADYFPKLADFGLARWLDSTRTPAAWKRMSGTPHYMSPEQCREEDCDERTDIYSLGATYYSLLTGCTPFKEGPLVRLMFEHCSAPVPDPRFLQPKIPGECAEVIRRAMAKQRADRFENARAIQNALRGVLNKRL